MGGDGAIGLGITGLSEHDSLILRSLLSILELNQSQRWELVDAAHCDILLMAVGHPAFGATAALAASQRPVLVGFGECEDEPARKVFMLPSPLRSRSLLTVLDRARAALAGVADQVDAESVVVAPPPVAAAAAPPVVPVASSQAPLLSEHWPARYQLSSSQARLAVDREAGTALVSGDKGDLFNLLRAFVSGRCQPEAVARSLDWSNATPLSDLLWPAAAAGLVLHPEGIDRYRQAALQLRRWPGRAALQCHSGYGRLCAALSRRAMPVQALVAHTGVAEEVAWPFVAAAEVQGLLQIVDMPAPAPDAAPQEPEERRQKAGIFQRIRQRLGLGKERE